MLQQHGVIAVILVCAFGTLKAQEKSAEKKRESPPISFKRGDAPGGLQETPDKAFTLKISGSTAQLYDSANKKPTGVKLSHDPSKIYPTQAFKISCWAFSPDGKLVATGAGNKQFAGVHNGEIDIDEGEVRVWEVPSGKLVATMRAGLRRGGFGIVKALVFSRDSKSVLIDAEDYVIDGP